LQGLPISSPELFGGERAAPTAGFAGLTLKCGWPFGPAPGKMRAVMLNQPSGFAARLPQGK
jgi:hypothetical protein